MLCLVSMPGAAFMIGCSRWLIPFLLGPQWSEAAPIFAVLAVLGFLRPIEGSNWWLFVTQERASEGLRWSVIGALITSVAVIVGVPWGALGVATAVTLASVVRMPLLIWYVTRRGPVRSSDIYRLLATPTLASGMALVALMVLDPWTGSMPPMLALASGLTLTGVVFFGVLATLPAGRRTLRDAWNTAMLLRMRRHE
jgi:PST family polysaccharide transporter